jgi:hypothetical protein
MESEVQSEQFFQLSSVGDWYYRNEGAAKNVNSNNAGVPQPQ